MGHFIKQGKLVICSSLFKRIPPDFFIKNSNRNKSSGSCGDSSRFILYFIELLFLV